MEQQLRIPSSFEIESDIRSVNPILDVQFYCILLGAS